MKMSDWMTIDNSAPDDRTLDVGVRTECPPMSMVYEEVSDVVVGI